MRAHKGPIGIHSIGFDRDVPPTIQHAIIALLNVRAALEQASGASSGARTGLTAGYEPPAAVSECCYVRSE